MVYRELFSARLESLRTVHSLSMTSLGRSIGVTDEAIRLLERGKRSPSFEALLALADYFDVSLDYLTGRSDDPKRY